MNIFEGKPAILIDERVPASEAKPDPCKVYGLRTDAMPVLYFHTIYRQRDHSFRVIFNRIASHSHPFLDVRILAAWARLIESVQPDYGRLIVIQRPAHSVELIQHAPRWWEHEAKVQRAHDSNLSAFEAQVRRLLAPR